MENKKTKTGTTVDHILLRKSLDHYTAHIITCPNCAELHGVASQIEDRITRDQSMWMLGFRYALKAIAAGELAQEAKRN